MSPELARIGCELSPHLSFPALTEIFLTPAPLSAEKHADGPARLAVLGCLWGVHPRLRRGSDYVAPKNTLPLIGPPKGHCGRLGIAFDSFCNANIYYAKSYRTGKILSSK